eukprot:TRINITY_DN74112_c0_g1_i1.p1 TRINITY_DN74112_c0_g1~~TRINITY_DN74112_c0_g1_i1.p1  ORF type:complete len:200 (+),score=21.69 TRINITY_DN74112_c0_g1_i1:80-601(+)
MNGGDGCWDMQKKGACPRSNCKWCNGFGGGCSGASGGSKGNSGPIVVLGKGKWGGDGYSASGRGVWTPRWEKRDVCGRGGGKGKNRSNRLSNVDPSLKVWIGNLPRTVTRETLEIHMNQASMTKSVDVDRGSGAAEYGSEAEVANAIALLNGSFLEGNQIVVDPWRNKNLPMS